MLLNDKDIRNLAYAGMIEPFSEGVSGNGVISYGLTSAGYDLRLGDEFLVFKNARAETIDPKRFKDPEYVKLVFERFVIGSGPVVIAAHSYLLARSLERIKMPRNIKGRCVGKSTYARCGILVNTTPLEPEWEGFLTIEIGNVSPCSAVIYAGEGIAQLEFELLTGRPETTYAMKGGKYQDQKGVVPARVL